MSFSSAFESDVFAAQALIESIGDRRILRLPRPVSAQVVSRAAEMVTTTGTYSSDDVLWKLKQLRGKPFDTVGFYACTLTALYLATAGNVPRLELGDLCLQRPPHEASVSIPEPVRREVLQVLSDVMAREGSSLLQMRLPLYGAGQ